MLPVNSLPSRKPLSTDIPLSPSFLPFREMTPEEVRKLANPPVQERQTLVHIAYEIPVVALYGGWLMIRPQTFLCDPASTGKLPLLHSVNIPVAPRKKFVEYSDKWIHFTLIFPFVPEGWKTFDLVENGGRNSFIKRGIARNASGVYSIDFPDQIF